MLPKKCLDAISRPSREFYERALAKLCYSLILASFGMMMLGLTAAFGGLSSYYKQSKDAYNLTGNADQMYVDLMNGYGFACFFSLLTSIAFIGTALYISPYVSSSNESKILKLPQEIVSVRNIMSYAENIEGMNKI
jgi:hypothetical protein